MYGLHEQLHVELALAWAVPSRATVSPYASNSAAAKAKQAADTFIAVTSKIMQKIEDGFGKGLEDLWPHR